MKTTNKSYKSIILWVLTVIFALTFLVFIPHIASLIALVVAVLLAPIQKWQDFLGKYVKGTIKTIAVIVLVILTIITIPTTETTDNDISPDTTLSSMGETTEPTKDKSRDYVLNTSTVKFHHPSCGSADDIKEDNREEYHGTREELISKGYKPCGKCHP
jgi:hypothetical protein